MDIVTDEMAFVDSIWPSIKKAIDLSSFAVDTSKMGVEFALKLAADVAITQWQRRESGGIS